MLSIAAIGLFAIRWSIGYVYVFIVQVYEWIMPVSVPPRCANVPADTRWLGGRYL